MKTWERDNYKVVEKPYDYSLHQFAVIQNGKEIAVITPDSLVSMESIIKDLKNGADVDGWEDGCGNTIRINTWGGKRNGAGRPSTGRKRHVYSVTEEEDTLIKELIKSRRQRV